MMKYMFLKTGLLAGASMISASTISINTNEPAKKNLKQGQKPNIVFIYADDLGYGSLGCYGATKVKTPNIDRMASQGRLFTDAHSSSAICTPSRYSLLTGEYAWRVDNWKPIFCHDPLLIDTTKTTVASLLKQQGYSTACIGKWHLGFGVNTPDWNGELKPGPLELGFDYYYGIPVVSSHPPFVFVENHRVVGLDPADPLVLNQNSNADVKGGKSACALYKPEELGPVLTRKALEWVRKHHDKPFFLYYATPLIHLPITPNPRFKGTSGCGLYGDYIQEFDWIVGQVLSMLDELKLSDNTLVIVTSDNGGVIKDEGETLNAWNAGLRLNGNLLGFKFGAWEGGHRVPFIAHWPGHIPKGSISGQLIGQVDMLATLAALIGQPLPGKDGVDSYNVLPALIGNSNKPIRDHLLSAPGNPQNLAIREGRWLYIDAQGSGGAQNGLKEIAITHKVNSDITPDGKIKPGAPPNQLYDLENDVAETTNVVLHYPEVAQKLKAQLDKKRSSDRTAPKNNKLR
ncbi:MAG: arylsulfatase [Bacteroidia bacterium]|nr:arylsulfatase [Bacteroidia bacterium]